MYYNVSSVIFELPEITGINIIAVARFTYQSLINFQDYNRQTLKQVYFSGSGICDYKNDSLNNQTWLDYIAINNSNLQQFIEDHDPCFEPCALYGTGCLGIDYKNGVCDNKCWKEGCDWDGGMCIVLDTICHIHTTILIINGTN